jgi:L-ascorbate metabolism protein UlaG (beta-lactamase superfamily)
MQVSKAGHACVRIEQDGQVVVIDPGSLSSEDALDGADAVLITHEHVDHVAEARLREALDARPGLRVWTNPSVAERLADVSDRVTTVGPGDAFEAAGLAVQVHGEWHAVIHPDIPVVRNIGFLVGGAVFHPGDAFTIPEAPVKLLMLPIHSPWIRAIEAVDYVRTVRPERLAPIHDGFLNEAGLTLVDGLFGASGLVPGTYQRIGATPVEV